MSDSDSGEADVLSGFGSKSNASCEGEHFRPPQKRRRRRNADFAEYLAVWLPERFAVVSLGDPGPMQSGRGAHDVRDYEVIRVVTRQGQCMGDGGVRAGSSVPRAPAGRRH